MSSAGVEKVVGFVVRGSEVLVFEHPTTGTQFPAGTVESGETALEAARREVAEEVGVVVTGGRLVGAAIGQPTRQFFAFRAGPQMTAPEFCDTDGHRFRPYWLAIEDIERVVHPNQRRWWQFGPRDHVDAPRFTRLEEGAVAVRAMVDADRDYEALGRWMSDDRLLAWYGGETNRVDAAGARAEYGPLVRGEDETYPAIIERGGEPAGYLQYYPVASYDEYQLDDSAPPGAWALDLFVAPEHWGQRTGRKAIELVLRYLDAIGVGDVFIDPWVGNARAIHTYERCGFRKVRVLAEHELHDSGFIDCWLMHRPRPRPDSQGTATST